MAPDRFASSSLVLVAARRIVGEFPESSYAPISLFNIAAISSVVAAPGAEGRLVSVAMLWVDWKKARNVFGPETDRCLLRREFIASGGARAECWRPCDG